MIWVKQIFAVSKVVSEKMRVADSASLMVGAKDANGKIAGEAPKEQDFASSMEADRCRAHILIVRGQWQRVDSAGSIA